MSEILLSLTIIGVVAAITLPSLTGNINEKVWNTQRKALYARMSQAISLMPAVNGYGIGATQEATNSNATQAFVTQGLSQVLKINNICDSTHLADCGIPKKIVSIKNTTPYSAYSQGLPENLHDFHSMFGEYSYGNGAGSLVVHNAKILNTKIVAFETVNGESIALYYNPYCNGRYLHTASSAFMQPYMCANFIYDLNGSKAPNKVGKDIGFITVLYSSDSVVVAPISLKNIMFTPQGNAPTVSNMNTLCQKADNNSRVPNLEEILSIFYNKELSGNYSLYHPTSTWYEKDSSKIFKMNFKSGLLSLDNVLDSGIICIKR